MMKSKFLLVGTILLQIILIVAGLIIAHLYRTVGGREWVIIGERIMKYIYLPIAIFILEFILTC